MKEQCWFCKRTRKEAYQCMKDFGYTKAEMKEQEEKSSDFTFFVCIGCIWHTSQMLLCNHYEDLINIMTDEGYLIDVDDLKIIEKRSDEK